MTMETQAQRGARIIRKIESQSADADDSATGGSGLQQSEASGAAGQTGAAEQTDAGRHTRIAILAYYKASERGFAPGGELDDWLAAEREIEMDQSGDAA
jgi:Protein of unknown function (DUF2934)